jgi:hypothetical protein
VARLGASVPFAEAAAVVAHFTGTTVSAATARRRTEAAGAAWVQRELAATVRLEAAPGAAAAHPGSQTAVRQLSVDGVFAPVVGGDWREVKLLAVGEVGRGADGEVRTTALSYFARMADHERFGRQALAELDRRGTLAVATVVAVADGADWIQGVVDLQRPDAVRVLDFAHAVGYLARAAQEAFGAGTAAAAEWVATWAHALKHGDPADALAAAAALPAGEARDDAVRYLGGRRDQIRYAEFAAAGYPIGSGTAESGAKTVVQARLCGAGMRWAPAHVDPMLALRTVVCGGRWDEAWPQIAAARRRQARLASADRRRVRLARRAPPAPAPLPAAPPPPALPSPAPPRPKRVVDGRPTADHPWKRRLLPPRHAAPTLPPKT